MHNMKTSSHLIYLYPKDHKGSCDTPIKYAKHKDNYYKCDFLTELRSATLHETISNYGTHEAKHNLTPELHACCSENPQCISNSLRHIPTTSLQLLFYSMGTTDKGWSLFSLKMKIEHRFSFLFSIF